MLAESFPDVDGLNDTKVMINTDERMCQMAHILPSQAMSIEGEDFAVQVRNYCASVFELVILLLNFF